MNREVAELKTRLESLVERWITASPAERPNMVLEKIRLEEALEDALNRSKARHAGQ